MRGVLIVFLAAFGCLWPPGLSAAEGMRKPAWAGSFYPNSALELRREIGQATDKARETRLSLPAGKTLRALILPHAGHIYSGLTAAHAGLVLKEKQFEKVILVGPDHHVGFSGGAVSAVTAYESPLGSVPLHADAAGLRAQNALFKPMPESDRKEHSLEVILPFLQVYLKEFQMVPVVVGGGDQDGIRQALEAIADEKTLLVASSDLSHFLPYEAARQKDEETIRLIMGLKSGELLSRENAACGVRPISIVLDMAKHKGWQPVLLHYCNSGDTAGNRARVVGYAAIAFYGESFNEKKAN